MTWSNLSWNWHQTVKFLTSKILAPNPPDMSPSLCQVKPQSLQNFPEKWSWSCKTSFSTWSVQNSQPKAFEVCASIQIHQSVGQGWVLKWQQLQYADWWIWRLGHLEDLYSHCFSTQSIVSWTSLIRGTTPVTLHENVTLKVNFLLFLSTANTKSKTSL